ncbi:hypothetical protein GN244_ATG19609 [Phytophthora infestans]|uniref:RxLR effector protein n=1 Tax=Phytophthora infestans TaxID=4787 RepID=A0A833S467_PHYIN|nr:hypothetical protein GN244_ATG19609 [Phytophthora infestans]
MTFSLGQTNGGATKNDSRTQFPTYPQARKSFHSPNPSPRIRLTYFLLFTASTAFLASGSMVSINNDAETRSLRSSKTAVNGDAAEEERGLGFDSSEIKALKKLASSQFHRMATDPEHLRMIFTSWSQAMKPLEEAADYMRSQCVSESAIEHFIAAYFNH